MKPVNRLVSNYSVMMTNKRTDNNIFSRLRVVSNLAFPAKYTRARKWASARRRAKRRGAENGASPCGASPLRSPFSRVYFAGNAKIRVYSQSTCSQYVQYT